MPDNPSDYVRYVTEITEALRSLSDAMRSALEQALPSGYGARSLGRALGIEQTTAWRCWRVAHSSDPALILQALPGRTAWEKVFRQLGAAGVGATTIGRIRESFARLEPLVFGRRKDRQALKAFAAGGLHSKGDLASMRELRRAAARANENLNGVASTLSSSAWLLAPGPEAGSLSLGVAGVIEGVRRSRHGPPWPILSRSVSSGEASEKPEQLRALGDEPSFPTLVRAASDVAIGTEVRVATRSGRVTIEVDRGALNRSTPYERLSRPKGPRGVSDEAFEQEASPTRGGGCQAQAG